MAGNDVFPNDTTDGLFPTIESIAYEYANFYALNKDNPLGDSSFVKVENIFHPKDELLFKVSFSETVYATGAPQLKLDIGGQDRYAVLSSGSGTHELWFKYTVQDLDHDLNGISISKDALVKNGGSIANAKGQLLQGFETSNHGQNIPVDFKASDPDQTLSISAGGLPVIDLGAIGQLIKPVQVEGKWYYLLDRDKNGGLDEGDAITYRDLTKDMNWNADGSPKRVDWFPTGENGELHGLVKALLPATTVATKSSGATDLFVDPTNQMSLVVDKSAQHLYVEPTPIAGTAVDSPTQKNENYDGLAAIWDAFNGNWTGFKSYSTTDQSLSGIPADWDYAVLKNGGKVWAPSGSPGYQSTFTLSSGMGWHQKVDELAYTVFEVI